MWLFPSLFLDELKVQLLYKSSVTRLGDFSKVICDKFLYNSSVKILWLFEPIWKHLFLGKIIFLEVFESNWATFYFNIWSPCMTTHVRARHLLDKRKSSSLSLSLVRAGWTCDVDILKVYADSHCLCRCKNWSNTDLSEELRILSSQ